MTVAELIEKLRNMPQDLPVIAYWGHDAELDAIEGVGITELYASGLDTNIGVLTGPMVTFT